MKKSKDYSPMLISRKTQSSNYSLVLKCNFNLNEEKVFSLSHIVCSGAYVKAV